MSTQETNGVDEEVFELSVPSRFAGIITGGAVVRAI